MNKHEIHFESSISLLHLLFGFHLTFCLLNHISLRLSQILALKVNRNFLGLQSINNDKEYALKRVVNCQEETEIKMIFIQAPPSMGFSKQKYWSEVPLPSPWSTAVILKAWSWAKSISIPWGLVTSARSQAEVWLRTFWSEALQMSLMHSQVWESLGCYCPHKIIFSMA